MNEVHDSLYRLVSLSLLSLASLSPFFVHNLLILSSSLSSSISTSLGAIFLPAARHPEHRASMRVTRGVTTCPRMNLYLKDRIAVFGVLDAGRGHRGSFVGYTFLHLWWVLRVSGCGSGGGDIGIVG